jgi:hypothetical protein
MKQKPTTKKERGGLDALIAELKKPKVPKTPALGISSENIKKARKASEMGATIKAIAKALKVSYPTAWKAVKGVAPYDSIK